MTGLPSEPFALWPDSRPAGNPSTLTAYLPAAGRATGASVVVCPGGSYAMLADHEGRDYALWLADQGITAFVLKYRLGSAGHRHPAMLEDAARAVRTVRHHSRDWNLDPARIGIMGSSAGGHLVSTLVTHFDGGNPAAADPIERESSRPNLGILCYPVISMGPLAHEESRRNLLGENPSAELRHRVSSELQARETNPPCFIWHTQDDQAVKVENALAFAAALQEKRVPFSLHIYPSGPHGIGLGVPDYRPGDDRPLHPWIGELRGWLAGLGYLK